MASPESRVLLAEDSFANANPDVRQAVSAALDKISAAGLLPKPESIATPAPTSGSPPRDLLRWYDEVFRVVSGWKFKNEASCGVWIRPC